MKPGSRVYIQLVMGLSAAITGISPALAGAPNLPVSTPTLDEFGLIGLGAIVGVAGLMALLRRKK